MSSSKQGEPSGLGLDLGHVGGRDAGRDAGGHLPVEANLDLVGPQGEAGAAALVVGRGELAHHARRPRPGLVVGEREARGVGHLARADGRRLERDHLGAVGQPARAGESAGQPLRGDVGGAAEECGRVHGKPTLLPGPAGPATGPAPSTPGIHPGINPQVDAGRGPNPDTGGMTFTDYLIDISLIAIVLFQVRGRRITTRGLLLPVGIVTYVAFTYLRGVPTAGNDLILVLGCAGLGALLGGLAGRFTSVHPDGEGIPVAKAGLAAAALWILGTGGRLAFQVYATHGGERRSSASAPPTASRAWRPGPTPSSSWRSARP